MRAAVNAVTAARSIVREKESVEELFKIHPRRWKQLYFNLQSEYFSLLDYVLTVVHYLFVNRIIVNVPDYSCESRVSQFIV